jgi:hypothetical protein
MLDPDRPMDSLDALGSLRSAGEPPPTFLAAIDRRRRRIVVGRIVGGLATAAAIALVALAIALPALRNAPAPSVPVIIADRPTSADTLTAASLRRFIDDPTILDSGAFDDSPGSLAEPIRAGDRPDSPAVRSLLTLN